MPRGVFLLGKHGLYNGVYRWYSIEFGAGADVKIHASIEEIETTSTTAYRVRRVDLVE